MPGPVTAYQTGVHGSRPANNAGCILYSCTTHNLVYRDDGTGWTTFLTLTSGTYSPGGTDVAVADGGTGSSTAAGARTNLGVAASTIQFLIDGGGSAITTGVKGYVEIPFDCTIVGVRALADQSGSIVVDIWKDSYANYPPVDADSITASAPVTISAATKSQDTTLTGWTTSLTEGQVLGFNVDSATTITRATIVLDVNR